MRLFHASEWQALQEICDELLRADGVVWAGVTDMQVEPRWIAFSGPDACAPLPPADDQVFHQTVASCPPGAAVVYLWPPRPLRAYVCGVLLPPGLTLVAATAVGAGGDEVERERGLSETMPAITAVREALERLRASLPAGGPPPSGAPPALPRAPPSSAPPYAWDWLPIPPFGRKPAS